ncbi:MAG: transglycosylase domain-containing protein, partial [Gemmatimonadaceae bacterium]
MVKNSLVGDEQDFSRKLREAFLAVELEKQMSKDDILERYLNSVYFGGGAYGVQAAAEYYFRKDAQKLDWAEGALLAALIRSPNAYDPFKNPELAKKRRSIVFQRLLATKTLTKDEVLFSETVPLPTSPNKPLPPYDYFLEEVKQQLLTDPNFGLGTTEEARNRAVFEGGIRVYTTFNPDMQVKAL